MKIAVATKRVYEPTGRRDGLRVLVMRLWPRGVRKSAVDLWLRELGADVANIRAWKAGRLTWPRMRARYLAGLELPVAAAQLAQLRTLARRRRVTLLCSCRDEARCHRGVLKALLARGRDYTLVGDSRGVRSTGDQRVARDAVPAGPARKGARGGRASRRTATGPAPCVRGASDVKKEDRDGD